MRADEVFAGSSAGGYVPASTHSVITREDIMAAHLRVYPEAFQSAPRERPEPTVRVSLGDLLPLINMAKRNNNLWLQDFLDDEVSITSDLYEILRAFSYYHRPSA